MQSVKISVTLCFRVKSFKRSQVYIRDKCEREYLCQIYVIFRNINMQNMQLVFKFYAIDLFIKIHFHN